MNYTSELYSWLMQLLLILGVLLIPVGIGFILIPDKIFKIANRLNRWIATDVFFNKINTPIYKERFFYRHHKLLGICIILIALTCLYLLTFYSGIEAITYVLIKLAKSAFEEWLFVVLYYLLIVALFLAVLFGLVMFVRPSALKSFEVWGNRWIDIETSLEVLNSRKDLPDRILPGNPRIFGFLILIAAIYIIYSVT